VNEPVLFHVADLIAGIEVTLAIDGQRKPVLLDDVTKTTIIRIIAAQPGGIVAVNSAEHPSQKPPLPPRVRKVRRTAPREESRSPRPRR